MFNTCVIKNNDSIDHSIVGVVVSPNETYVVPDTQRVAVATNDLVLEKISTGKLIVGDGNKYFTNISQGIDWLKGLNAITVESSPPFLSKILPNGKKLFSRVHGVEFSVTTGSNNCEFSIPYPAVKFNELEIINAEIGEKATLTIKDDSNGTYTTIPNYTLNTFGNAVNIAEKYYKRKSDYDADLYLNMVIHINYTSLSNKTIYVNYILHEVKD